MKRRLLRILLTILVVLGFTLYFAFSTFLFSPFEDDYGFHISSLIPREVDFYLSKADLADDFDPFPRPAFARWLEETPGGEAVLTLPPVQEQLARLQFEEALAELEASLAAAPVEVDLLEVLGGRDLALAGWFHGPAWEEAEWAAYARTNWIGKLGIALLDYPGMLGLDASGLVITELDWGVRIEGGELSNPLFLGRLQDVIVIASSERLLSQAFELESVRGQNSFGLSAKFGDHIGAWEGEGDEVQAYVDYDALAEARRWPGTWPDPLAETFTEKLMARFFQVGTIRELGGIVGFANGFDLRLAAMLSSETMTPFQKRLYRLRGFEPDRVLGARQVATLVPADVGLFAYAHVDIGDLLREARQCAETDLVSNLDDLVREVWGHPDAMPLIDEIDAAFKSRVAVMIREKDYPVDPAGPPHNDLVVPAWAVVFWIEDAEKLRELHTRITNRQDMFGISGADPGSRGVFENIVQGGHKVYEYWSQLLDGTGHLATLELEEYFIVSNHHKMLGSLIKTYYDGAPSYPRLADDAWFSTQVNSGLARPNVLAWMNPRAISKLNRDLARQEAELGVSINWDIERPRIEKLVLKREFPGEVWGQLSEEVQARLDQSVQPELDAFQQEFYGQHVPALLARKTKNLEAFELLTGMLVEIALDQKRLQFLARPITPVEN